MKKVKIYGLLISALLLLSTTVVQASTEKHREVTKPRGKVIFFLKSVYPVPIEQISFISNVHHLRDVEVYMAMLPLTPEQAKVFNEDKEAYIEKAIQPPAHYKPDAEKLIEEAKNIKGYKAQSIDADETVKKYNVKEFPSFIYLTQDGYLYRFPFVAYESTPSRKAFWQTFNKHKNKTPISKGWNKKWSQ